MKEKVVISLFGGMECGRIAFDRLGVPVKYYSSEVNKQAISVVKTKWPDVIHVGDVSKVSYKDGKLITENGEFDVPVVDYLIGGSPCQGFSFSGKGLAFDDPRSKLFFEYHRILLEIKDWCPNVKFLLENVVMHWKHVQVITEFLGIEPIRINSSLLSAQNRERLYWTNIASESDGLFDSVRCSIKQPEDKGIYLKDILQPENEVDKKYYISDAALARFTRKNYSKPKVNPEKAGTLDTSNNSSRAGGNAGTTLIQQGVVNDNGMLRDVEKAPCVDANYFKGMDNHAPLGMVWSGFRQDEPMSSEDEKSACRGTKAGGALKGVGIIIPDDPACARIVNRKLDESGTRQDNSKLPFESQLEPRFDGKSGTLTSVQKDNTLIVPSNKVVQLNENKEFGDQPRQQNRIYDPIGKSPSLQSELAGGRVNITVDSPAGNNSYWKNKRLRRLTPIEVCRLQTVPDSYFFHESKQIISDSAIYRMTGNGWTCSVIEYILSHSL